MTFDVRCTECKYSRKGLGDIDSDCKALRHARFSGHNVVAYAEGTESVVKRFSGNRKSLDEPDF